MPCEPSFRGAHKHPTTKLAVLSGPWPDPSVVGPSDLKKILSVLAPAAAWSWTHGVALVGFLVRTLSHRTGVPALLIAAILLVVGYRVLRRTARFVVEVVLVALALALASALGWIRW